MVFLWVEIRCHAEWCSDFILTTISLSDCSSVVILTIVCLWKLCKYLFSTLIELLWQRKHSNLYRCKCRMEMEYCSYIRLLRCTDILLIISCTKESEYYTVSTKWRLDNVWQIFLILLVIEVCKILSWNFLMTSEMCIRDRLGLSLDKCQGKGWGLRLHEYIP